MATSTLYFSGKASWAKLSKPDTKFNPVGQYTINLELDQANLQKFNDSKMQLKIKYNDEGKPFVTFKRVHKALMRGELVELGKPQILNTDGQPENPDIAIGNGSDVTVKITTYDGAKGKGHRLEAVRIDTLIPYGDGGVVDQPDEGMPF